nr:FGGY-family carbohydrate kinase [Ornithinimicrobium sp. INDO-MA30-4]
MTPANFARAAVEGMLLNLLSGIEALRAQGASANRVFLIGGASASQAVQQVAAQLFGLPVVVPEPGEYVALGAARQAAWALSRSDAPPEWPISLVAELPPEPGVAAENAEIIHRYAEVLRLMHNTF